MKTVTVHIQSKLGKIGTRKTPNTDNFHAVILAKSFIIVA